ncbi:MAG: glutamate--tRNA ligase [Parcubacteria group bacterium CG11_big_fil_rev_8_21_14_0_20_39_22]|nr:MAG: glutamate--tRNA ligase [Parcubacteria group bacterium CG11_big_fil_rev_8_21_14_0_20_39_22]
MENMVKKPVVRIAPSPTGLFHIGTARTALFNYLFAKQNGGLFLVRIEDTDKKRSEKRYEEDIMAGFKWLSLENDGFLRQSDNNEKYKGYIKKLIDENKAYVSNEKAKEGEGMVDVVRFRNPGESVSFNDLIRGEITFDTSELGDFVIARSVDEPLYHMTVVIDDFESSITHIIRGEDHISNTPRQILIAKAIGAPIPEYAHLPLILATDKSKLSKRKHGESVSIAHYMQKGYLPEAMNNFLALLGWHPKDDQEFFSINDLIKDFDLTRVQKGGAVFNIEKLDWINREYIKRLPEDKRRELVTEELEKVQEFKKVLGDTSFMSRFSDIVLERVAHLSQISDLAKSGEFSYIIESIDVEPKDLIWKKDATEENAKKHLQYVWETWKEIGDENWNIEFLKSSIWNYVEKEGRGNVLWPTRIALSGKEKSPDPFTLAFVLGREEALSRIQKSIEILSK